MRLENYKESLRDDDDYYLEGEADTLVFDSADEIKRLREALTFYADQTNYQDYDEWSPGTSDVMSDYGRKAKSALEETK
jgi:hypothetical protein